MRAVLKQLLQHMPWYAAAKKLYRHTFDREGLRRSQQLTDFYAGWVDKHGLVFDVGANRGEFAGAFLRLGASVVAVEPHPACVVELRALYSHDSRFTLLACALGAKPGNAELYLGENGMDNMSTLSEEFRRDVGLMPGLSRAGWSQSVTVPVDTLDRLIARHGKPDFCKIDVEGYDLEVLRGLSVPLPLVQFEYHPWNVDKAVQCVDYLEALGMHHFNITIAKSRENEVTLQPSWLEAGEVIGLLRGPVVDTQGLGDVFARP